MLNDEEFDSTNPWKTLESNVVYQSPWITVHEDKVITPGGTDGIYSVVDGKDGVLVIAESGDDIYVMQAYRYPIKKWVWELCSGGIERGDTPLICAQKELQEELGLTSKKWVQIGAFSPSYGGAMTDRQYVFLAQDVQEGSHKREPGEAVRAVKKVPRAVLFELIRRGTVEDGQTLAGLLHYKLWLEQIAEPQPPKKI